MWRKSFVANTAPCAASPTRFNQNYGVLGVLDRLHGTDAQFRASLAYQRHFMLMSATPVTQQVPEPPKKKQSVSEWHKQSQKKDGERRGWGEQ